MSHRLLANVFNIIEREQLLSGTFPLSKKMVDFLPPHELSAKLPLEIGENKLSEESLAQILQEVTRYSVKTTHPGFYNQQFGGVDPYGLCGAILAEALNTNAHTYEVAPVFMVIEKHLVDYIGKLFGFEKSEGLFCAGGSMACMYGMVLARHRAMPELKTKGFFGSRPLAAFASEDSHYWIKKAATWLGYGSENIYLIPSDENGRMIPSELEKTVQKCITEGKIPNFVCAMAGTTIFGAFDDYEAILAICQTHSMWLHVDCCWGGAAVLSAKRRHVMKGIERVDSFSWNVHKMLCAPLQSSLFCTKHTGELRETLSVAAGYLFQPDKMYDRSFDLGDLSIQCGRKVDAFKVWFMFKAHGGIQMEELVDNAFDMAEYFFELVQNRPGFEPVLPEIQCTNVCFWYIPKQMRGQERDKNWWTRLHKVAPILKEKMVRKGSLMIGFQEVPSKNLVNFLRIVITVSPQRTKEDMEYVIREIEELGENLEV